jgi:hypothetical protein
MGSFGCDGGDQGQPFLPSCEDEAMDDAVGCRRGTDASRESLLEEFEVLEDRPLLTA